MKRYGYHRTSTREQHLELIITEVDRLGRNKKETLADKSEWANENGKF